jgi:argininosuccinate synthase
MSTSTKPKVILAYSGGLDTSVILKWLSEKGFEVICFCADVGQQHEDFEAVKLKATNTGATKCIVTDLRSEFVSNYIFEALKCNAIYEGRYLLGDIGRTSMHCQGDGTYCQRGGGHVCGTWCNR